MKAPRQIQKLIAEIMDDFPQAEIEFEPLPSGVCRLNIWYGRRNFEMEYSPIRGTGVSENFENTPPFTGHDKTFNTLDGAVEHFKSLLADAARTEADHLPQAFVLHDKKS
ncbi:MAG TPA: hypothetical protein VFM25_06840 [Verrucomicrobiae bacterium]|jgi:hypothetical protein|nr:hypothetical protein [Verrucomicrobiae bacterium]